MFLPESYGAVGDGIADDTGAINAALSAAYNNKGGTIFFNPNKTYLCTGQIVIPNDSGTIPKQPPYRLTSSGATTHAGQTGVPKGGAKLDLRYGGSVAKIDTRGLGGFEMDHLTLMDNGTSSTPFFQTTNTTVFIHHNRFQGNPSKSGITCDQDAIVCGGTRGTGSGMGGDSDSGFQGYGSVISENNFSAIRRGIFGRTAFNANTIRENWFLHDCGSNLAGGAAIELLGIAADGSAGNNILFNTIEVAHYPYGIKAQYSVLGTYIGNGMYDPTVTHLAGIRFEVNANYNTVIDGFRNDTYPGMSDATGSNTFLTSHQSQASIIPQPQNWTNASGSKFITAGGQGPITEDAGGDQWYNSMQTANGAQWTWQYKPAGGSVEQQAYFWRVDANTRQLVLVGNGNHKVLTDAGQITVDSGDSTKFVQVGGTARGILGGGGGKACFYGGAGATKQTVAGKRGGVSGLKSLLAGTTAMAQFVDSTVDGKTAVAYSASMTIDASVTDLATITATDGVAFTINAPTNPVSGDRLRVRIRNTSGGALGAATWNAAFKMTAWTQPANGFSRTIDFDYDGTNWIESNRSAADVAN